MSLEFPCPAPKCIYACGYPLARQKMYRHLSEAHEWSQQEASAHAETIPRVPIDPRDRFIAEIADMDAFQEHDPLQVLDDLIRRARLLIQREGGD
jgi:hypothetical protein